MPSAQKGMIFLILLVFILLPLASAAAVVINPNVGYDIAAVDGNLVVKQYTTHVFDFHVYNITNGLPKADGISCYFHLYNSTGEHLVLMENSTPTDKFDYEFIVAGGNFSENTRHTIIIHCNDSVKGGYNDYSFPVTATGYEMTTVQVSIYIFFLLACLVVIFLCGWMVSANPFEKDTMNYSAMYEQKKRNNAVFYLKLIKRKLWIAGLFGVYLGTVIFIALTNQILNNLRLSDLFAFTNTLLILLLWGAIPFVIFWIIYFIIFVYKAVEETLKYQFGIGRER